ncbi:serine acetyltransferase 1, chloroplastic-like [Solanum dulcamara]|uniref:serine acetyltransferase 1, chloroplastic-like n=1 Tax=Solanum dulcamara TaxID=45834 RepID=UPI002485A399|nr:serine acetyltransferase 1, chloroplastic-like [Solanum dulcamara]XP_055823284.1 serine acetyltransferase 1, chloroplastic-like [Solanum dulcamara]
MSTNFLGSPFPFIPVSSPHKSFKLSSFTMAACIHASRTKNPPKNPISRDPNKPQIDDHVYDYVKYCRSTFPDLVSSKPISEKSWKIEEVGDELWLKMKEEARSDIDQEPILSSYYVSSILAHESMERALANHLSMKLSNSNLPNTTLYDLFVGVLTEETDIIKSVKADLRAVKERDPACISYVHCFLNFKGFLACQAHRVAHKLWSKGRQILALLIQNRVSEVFDVDIHPGAKIGKGILLDHATGVVVGETAVIGNNVSILHNVTLGGTGKACGDRHPKIGDGVLIGAGTCVLGNVKIGDGAKIGAGSVVLKEVPARTTAVGNPARLLGGKDNPKRLDKIPSLTMDHTSHMSEWSDYVI